ncbi:ATP-binding protein [Nocardioidaceae bacterium]|nr:ATP-binding protein [Nocardioidaceae bacterium]
MTIERERTEQTVHHARPRATHAACTETRNAFEHVLEDGRVVRHAAAMAALALGELLSNAVRHGQAYADGCIEVSWTLAADRVRISVTDAGVAPRLDATLPSADSPGGRGLWMVEQVSVDWGVVREGGTEVWAVFAAPRRG